MQTIAASFLAGIPQKADLGVLANGYLFQVRVKRVNLKTPENPCYVYEIEENSWKTYVKHLKLEMGMTIVFAKNPFDWLWLMAFDNDGMAHTDVQFHGANRLRRVQLPIAYNDRSK